MDSNEVYGEAEGNVSFFNNKVNDLNELADNNLQFTDSSFKEEKKKLL